MTEETKDDVGAADDNKGVRDDAAAEKLQANNAQLRKELAEARAAKRELEEYRAQKEAEAEKAQEEADKKAGEFAKLEAKLKAEAETYKARYEALVGENALKTALIAAKVDDPYYMEAAEAIMLRKGLTITKDGEAQIEGQPVAEFVKAWAESDAGKRFILNGNSGGGAAGQGAAKSSEPNPFKAETINRTEQARLFRDDPEKARRLQREAGLITG